MGLRKQASIHKKKVGKKIHEEKIELDVIILLIVRVVGQLLMQQQETTWQKIQCVLET